MPWGQLSAPHLPGQHAQQAAPKASAVQGREPRWPPGAKGLCHLLPWQACFSWAPCPLGLPFFWGVVLSSRLAALAAHARGQRQSAPSPQVLPEVPCSPCWVQKPCLGAGAPTAQRAGGALCASHPGLALPRLRLRLSPSHASPRLGQPCSALSLPDSSENETAVSGRAGRGPGGGGDGPELRGRGVCAGTQGPQGWQPREGPSRWALGTCHVLQSRGCLKAFADEEAVGASAATSVLSSGARSPLGFTLYGTPLQYSWKIPWTEEPVRLQSMGSLRVGHD